MKTISTQGKLCAVACATALLGSGCFDDLSTSDNGDESDAGAMDSGTTTQVDGSASTTVLDASDEEAWVYFDFDSGEEVDEDDGWDVAAQRFKLKTNGGVSGDGDVAVAIVKDVAFGKLKEAPEDGYLEDAEDGSDDGSDEDFVFLVDGGWYDYDGSDHSLSPKDWVYVVRSTEERFFKVQMRAYYDDAGTSGFPKFRWAEIDPPGGDIDVGIYDGGPEGDGGMAEDYGCYSGAPAHTCDCDTTEDACEGTWTESCACSEADDEDAGVNSDAGTGDAGVGAGYGCYSGAPAHTCDCASTEASCEGTWTESCGCGESDDDAGTETDAGDPAAYGCYSGAPEHTCDCDGTEESCAGTWTDACACDSAEEEPAEGFGCYLGAPTHTCDCELGEPDCTSGGYTWTSQCSC